jgi:hypothetical protein
MEQLLEQQTLEEEEGEEDIIDVLREEEEDNKQQDKPIQIDNEYEIISYINDTLGLGFDIDAVKDTVNLQNFIEAIRQDAVEEYLAYNSNNETKYASEITKSLDDYIRNGGNLDDFILEYTTRSNYYEGLMKDLDQYSPEQIVYSDLLNAGYSEEEALSEVEELLNAGTLEKQANVIKRKLQKEINKEKEDFAKTFFESKNKELKEAKEAEVQEIESTKREIATALSKTNSIAGIPLDDNLREELFNFLTEYDSEGYTPFDKSLLSTENLLLMALIAKKGNQIFSSMQTKWKEEGKKLFFNKLSPTPQIAEKKGSGVKSGLNIKALNDD